MSGGVLLFYAPRIPNHCAYAKSEVFNLHSFCTITVNAVECLLAGRLRNITELRHLSPSVSDYCTVSFVSPSLSSEYDICQGYQRHTGGTGYSIC